MTLPPLLPWSIAVALGAAGLWIAGSRASAAHAEAVRERIALEALAAKAGELARLRAALPPIPPRADAAPLSERLPATLAACGLPAAVLAGVAPGGEATVKSADGAPRARRTSATVSLQGLTLPQLGRVLEAWRAGGSGWTPVRLELAPLPGQRPGPAGGDLPLRVTMGLERLEMIEGAAR